MKMKNYLVVDFEATCCDDGSFPRNEMEIIEIGAVMLSAKSRQPLDEYQSFVRPVRNPNLTEFCSDLTSITQSQVETARPFAEVLDEFVDWAQAFRPYSFCSWGNFDRFILERDCKYHQVRFPFRGEHINLKAEFSDTNGSRRIGVTAALKSVGLKFAGTHHRGIDDARNICSLIPYIFPPSKDD